MKHIASILRLTIFFLMTSTIGGCQLGKHYTRPQIEMPEVLDSLSMDSTSISLGKNFTRTLHCRL